MKNKTLIMKPETWNKKYLEKISKMTNEELLDEYSYLLVPDDYDNCYSSGAKWALSHVKKEFRDRLIKIGYLKE